jgi:uncharacterized membrane protein YgdD (TMEM256/DUF423 family)
MRRALQLFALVVAGVFVAVLVEFYADNQNNPLMPSGRWLGWAGYTVLLGVFVVREYRQNWSRVSFWLAVVGLLVVHTTLYAVAFQAVTVWRGIWFLPISLAEYPLLVFALHWLGYGQHRRPTGRRVS